MTDTKSTAKGAYKNGEEEKERDRRGRLLRSGEGRGERLYRRARQIGAPAPVILPLHYPCRSARPPCHSVPPLVILSAAKNLFSHPLSSCPTPVILSEAKNLFSRLRDMAQKILRRCAPQNDSSLVILSPTPYCHSERSEESSLPSQGHGLKDSSERSSSE